jgi:hypothetical protein
MSKHQRSINYKTGRLLSVISVPVSAVVVLFIIYLMIYAANDPLGVFGFSSDAAYRLLILILAIAGIALHYYYHVIGFKAINVNAENRVWMASLIISISWSVIWTLKLYSQFKLVICFLLAYCLLYTFLSVRALFVLRKTKHPIAN